MVFGVSSPLVAAVVFLVGIALVVESVETFVESVADAALALGVSTFFLTVLLAGTDLENAVLGIAAVTGDLPAVALGTVFGEALFILGVGVGIAGVFVPFEVRVPGRYQLLTLLSPALLVALSLDGTLSRLDGVLLTCAFLPFVLVVYWSERDEATQFLAAEAVEESTETDEQTDAAAPVADGGGRSTLRRAGLPLLAVAGMTVGSELAVSGARELLSTFGIPGLAFGATVMSFIASLEELLLTVEPVRQGQPHLGIGNVVGSMGFFMTANAGLIALFQPLNTSGTVITVHWPFLLGMLAFVTLQFARGRITRPAGTVLLLGYLGYWTANFLA